jgi:hypothetical protein
MYIHMCMDMKDIHKGSQNTQEIPVCRARNAILIRVQQLGVILQESD